jgi:hypothetical protein
MKPKRNADNVIKKMGIIPSSAILLGFADSIKNGWQVGWSAGDGETQSASCGPNPTYELTATMILSLADRNQFFYDD